MAKILHIPTASAASKLGSMTDDEKKRIAGKIITLIQTSPRYVSTLDLCQILGMAADGIYLGILPSD